MQFGLSIAFTEAADYVPLAIAAEQNGFSTIKPGAQLSLQLHHHRAEHWVVVSGTARITCGEKVFLLEENQSTYIPIGERHRIEMHLISRKAQTVRVLGHNFSFRPGETIHTENSYKYSLDRFTALARGSGWTVRQSWTDAARMFSVHVLVASE